MLTFRQISAALRELGLTRDRHLMAHVDLQVLGPVQGGAETLLGALTATCDILVTPTFTPQTMVTPASGPAGNGLTYRESDPDNLAAELFHPELPADPALGLLPEVLLHHRSALRSRHPIYSFGGMNAAACLAAQTLEDPLGPIGWLAEADADVLLLGASQTANVSLHYAERQAGRKQFVRWALSSRGVIECPGCPGCPDGFEAIDARLQGIFRALPLGQSLARLIPLRDLIHTAAAWIREDPRALLCDRAGCPRCRDVRAEVHRSG